jgi:hypothetical protein
VKRLIARLTLLFAVGTTLALTAGGGRWLGDFDPADVLAATRAL